MNRTNRESEFTQKIDILEICMDFLKVFRRMWGRVVLLAMVGTLLMAYQTDKQYLPYYTASSTFTINICQEQQGDISSSSNFFDNEAAEQMAITFPYILTSGVLQKKAAQELGVSAVPGAIHASVLEGTNILTLSVTDTDPERAYKTLQAVVNNYPSVSEVIVGKVNMRLLDETGVPSAPDNVKDLVSGGVKGAVFGVALGILWVAVVTLLRKTIRREEDCPRLVNQRCLGTLPFVRFKERSKKKEHYLNILNEDISIEFKEGIRMIRNKVERHAKDNSLKTILVTSALAGEGKSTLAVNLAISLAQEGRKVALVDCDLRNPSDSEILNVEKTKGLVDYLNKAAKVNECIYSPSELEIDQKIKFIFMPGGKAVADGTPLLGSERMKWVIDFFKDRMDYVILDSAPVGLLTDASVLAQHADGALFIVKKDYARIDHILDGMEHLAESNIQIIGCVLNGD